MKQRDIVLLSYPFTDLKGAKVRPALVISNNKVNTNSEDCIMVPLTTVLKEEFFSIIISENDLISGTLIKPSRIKVDKIFTVRKSLVLKKIGILSLDSFEEVMMKIQKLF